MASVNADRYPVAPQQEKQESKLASGIPVIRPIQYLRGIAALMVVWHHGLIQIAGVQAQFPAWATGFGTSGVDLFFVISGFIMAVTTHGRDVTPMGFIRRRIVRVVPLYWLLTLLMVAVALVAPSLFKTLIVAPGTLLLSLFFIPHFSASFPGIAWPLLVPGWTLNYEMFFYAVFAVCLALPAVVRAKALVGTMLLLVLAGYVFGPFASAAGMTYTNPLLLEFAAGVVVGRLFCAGQMRLPFSASVAAVILGLVLLITRDSALLHFYGQFIGAVLVVAGSLHPRFSEYVNRPLQALGDASYSIYLTHIFTLGVLRMVWSKVFTGETTLACAIAFMIVALMVASVVGCLCFRWVETPLLNRLTRLKRAKKTALASA